MMALQAYSNKIQLEAFRVANLGGDYANAKAALETTIAIEGAAGGAREAAVIEMINSAVEITRLVCKAQ